MDLLGRAKQWMSGKGGGEPAEDQPFRVACPSGHVVRGRRTEGYQAIRCPECGEGVFVLPASPLPTPLVPASARAAAASAQVDDAPIPLSDHAPESPGGDESDWFEPVDLGDVPDADGGFDPVEAAVEELRPPSERPEAPPRRPAVPAPERREPPRRPSRAPSRPAVEPVPVFEDDPEPAWRTRRRRPILVGLAVASVVVLTVVWTVYRNQRRDYPAQVLEAREEGIPAFDRGDFDRAYRLLARGSAAVEALGGQIGGAEEVRQAAREAEIIVELVADPLEEMLVERARVAVDDVWEDQFNEDYRGRSILIAATVTGTPETSAGRFEINYQVLADGANAPRRARIDFEGFRLFELGPPGLGEIVTFGARLAAFDREAEPWTIRLQPESGVRMTHFGALEALGWTPFETDDDPIGPIGALGAPAALMIGLVPPPPQDLGGQPREQVRLQLGRAESHARSASQGEFVEQWIYQGPSGTTRYLNFLQNAGRGSPAVVWKQFAVR